MMKRFKVLAVSTALTLALVGCGSSENNTSNSNDTTNADSKIEMQRVVTDREGNVINVPNEVNSIVSLAPSITETLVDLGYGDKIVAVDNYSVGEDGIQEGIPSFDMMTPDLEGIVALQPDLIIASGISKANSEDPFKMAKDMGITVTYMPAANSIDEIKENVLFLGAITSADEKAQEIVDNFESEIQDIKTKVEALGEEQRTVYFEISPAPDLYSFGTGTFLNEALEILNGKNIFEEQQSWIPVTEEEVLARNPQVIFTNTYLDDPVTEIMNRPGWDVVDAVKNNDVYYVSQKYSSQDNEFVLIAIEEMAKAMYPEIFN